MSYISMVAAQRKNIWGIQEDYNKNTEDIFNFKVHVKIEKLYDYIKTTLVHDKKS